MSYLGTSLRRYCAAFAFAATTTGALLLLMQHLIQSDEVAITESKPPIEIDFYPEIVDQPPEPTPQPPEPPEKVERPPEMKLVTTADPVTGTWGGEFQPPVKPQGPINVGLERADGGLLPIAQVVPNYPERAKRSGIEGYVIVEFTVDTAGAVRDAVVVEAQPQGIFNRSALNAVLRSKYRPRVEGGKAQIVQGVLKRVSFSLKS